MADFLFLDLIPDRNDSMNLGGVALATLKCVTISGICLAMRPTFDAAEKTRTGILAGWSGRQHCAVSDVMFRPKAVVCTVGRRHQQSLGEKSFFPATDRKRACWLGHRRGWARPRRGITLVDRDASN